MGFKRIFGAFVRFTLRLKLLADILLLTDFLRSITSPCGLWCHLAQLHQVSHCASVGFASPTGVSASAEMGMAATKPSLIASSRFSSLPKKSINLAGSLSKRLRIWAGSSINSSWAANTALTANYKWVVAITESGVKSKQSDQDAPGGVVDDYDHEHALRGVVGSTLGSDVNTAAVSAGYVREKHFYVVPKAKWNAANCDVVVWVYNADTKEVVQVEKVALK